MTVAVSGLFVYPIKSCGGISVARLPVGRRGPEEDRRFMVVDEAGSFVTQREEPTMTLVGVALAGDQLVMTAPGAGQASVPRRPTTSVLRREVKVWGDTLEAIEVPAGSAWMSAFLDRPVHLVYMPDDVERQVSPKRAKPGDIVGFADAYPLLVVGQPSLDDLNGRLRRGVSMERFRPNVVVDGSVPYAEDAWTGVQIGEMTFRGVKRCDRCSIVTVDPMTGEKEREPLATLSTYRKEGTKVWFGMNLIHDGEGTLAVGDAVEVLV